MNLKNLFRTKTVEDILHQSANSENQLKRALGPIDLVFLGIGAIIGAGIFVITGTAAAGGAGHIGAGPAIVLSFLITGIACGFAALCYAEFASMIPIAGSAYTYSYATLGEFVAWIIGWDLILEYMVASAAVAIGWSGYCKSFLETLGGGKYKIPQFLTTDIMTALEVIHEPSKYIKKFADKFPELASNLTAIANDASLHDKTSKMLEAINAVPGALDPNTSHGVLITFYNLLTTVASAPHIGGIPICINLPAVLVIIGITVLLVIGISESSKMNNIIVALKFVILAIFVIVGIQHVNPANWTPFMPNGWHGVQVGAAMIFFAYIGFDAISTTAEEAKNPGKDMPVGIIGALAVCTLLYIVVSGIMTGMCPWNLLGTAEPVATALHYVGEHMIASYIVSVGAVISLLAVLIVMMMAQPRVFMSMSRDGFVPIWLSKIHPKFKTPYRSTIINGVIVAIIAGIFNINEIAELCNIGTLFAFVLVCLSILVLRKRSPELERPFKTPFVPYVPILGAATCLFLMLGLPPHTWIRFVVWLAIGLIIYFAYGHKHTRYNKAPLPAEGPVGDAVAEIEAEVNSSESDEQQEQSAPSEQSEQAQSEPEQSETEQKPEVD